MSCLVFRSDVLKLRMLSRSETHFLAIFPTAALRLHWETISSGGRRWIFLQFLELSPFFRMPGWHSIVTFPTCSNVWLVAGYCTPVNHIPFCLANSRHFVGLYIWGPHDAGYAGSLVVEGTVNVSGATFGIQAVGQFLRSNPSLILAIFLFEILGWLCIYRKVVCPSSWMASVSVEHGSIDSEDSEEGILGILGILSKASQPCWCNLWFMYCYDIIRLPSGNLLVCYWKWSFIVDFPIKNGDFP